MPDITTKHNFYCDLDSGPCEAGIKRALMHQDALADTFRVAVCRGHEAVPLAGMTAYGYLYFTATRQTLPLTGTVDEHYASVTLTDDCYAQPGLCSLVIQLMSGSVRHTVLKVDFVVKRTGSGSLYPPGIAPTLADLIARIEALEQGGGGSGGGSGEDGGYYTPGVAQTSDTTMRVSYTPSKTGMPGVNPVNITLPKGPKGDTGAAGAPGFSPLIDANRVGKAVTLTIADANYTKTVTINDGADGKTPVKGVDYWTEADQEAVVQDVLDKTGNTDVDTQSARLLRFISNTDIDYAYDAGTGANYTVIRVYRDRLDGTKQYPHVYAPNGVNAGTMTTYDLATAEGWLLAINAGVFNVSTRKPDGMLIQNGKVLQGTPTATHSQCKPLTIDANGNLGYAAYNADANELVAKGIVSAVTGFIPIIVDYKPVPSSEWNSVDHYTQNAQRQIIGQFGNGDYAIITCEGRDFQNSDGWTLAEAQTICQKHGLKFAYNLDGGGSTETMIGYKHINTIYEGSTGRIVPTFIVFNGETTFDHAEAPEPEIVIPPEYTQVEYIQATGKQYINTGIPETELYSIEYTALNENWHGQAGHIMSSANTYMPFLKDTEMNGKNNVVVKLKGHEDLAQNSSVNLADRALPYTIRAVYNGTALSVYINDTLKYSAYQVGATALTSNMYYLFTYGGNLDATQYRFTGKFYGMTLRDKGGSLVHRYVPVKDNSGVYGLYDTVDGVFHTSATSTAFSGA